MPCWLVTTGPDDQLGINGGLMQRQGIIDGQVVMAYACTANVPALDEYVHKTVQAGGNCDVPKMPIPGVGWLTYCKANEGSIFGMMKSDVNCG